MSSYWNPYDSAFFKVQLLVVSVSGLLAICILILLKDNAIKLIMYAPFDTLIKKEKLFVIIS